MKIIKQSRFLISVESDGNILTTKTARRQQDFSCDVLYKIVANLEKKRKHTIESIIDEWLDKKKLDVIPFSEEIFVKLFFEMTSKRYELKRNPDNSFHIVA